MAAIVSGHIQPHHATTFDPAAAKKQQARPPQKSATTSTSDPYYGHGQRSKLCTRFVTHLFACPSHAPHSAAAPPAPSPDLAMFIAYALHRTRLADVVTFAALFLLQRLKQRFPAARGSSGHRLFLSAFMIASKVICDDTYSNKSWSIVGQGMFALREVNQMEREMCAYLDWELNIDGAVLDEFTAKVTAVFSGTGPYHDIVLEAGVSRYPAAQQPAKQPTLDAKAAPPAPMRKSSAPAALGNPIRRASAEAYPPGAGRNRYSASPESSPESPTTPDSSHSLSTSPESTPSPRTPPRVEEAYAKIHVPEPAPYALAQGGTNTAATKAQYMQEVLRRQPGAPPYLEIPAAGSNYGPVVHQEPVKPRSASAARALVPPAGKYGRDVNAPYAFAVPIDW